MPYRLAIDDGRTVQTLDVGAERLSVGTSSACRLRLASAGVAFRHAAIRQEGDRVVVEDLSRAPNITVDGRSVVSASVAAGSVIGIGGARIRVLAVTHETPAAPAPTGAARTCGVRTDPPRRGAVWTPKGETPATGRALRLRKARRRLFGPGAVSVALHLAVLLGLHSFVLQAGRAPPTVATVALRPEEIAELVEPDEVPALRDPPEWTAPPLDPLPDDAPPLAPPEELFAPPPERPPPEPPPFAPPDERVEVEARRDAATVGVGGPPDIPARSFGKDEAGKANGLASELLSNDRGGGAALRAVQGKASEAKVWVVRGDYDEAERVLLGLDIAHLVVPPSAIEEYEIPETLRVLVFNCTGKPLSEDAARRIGLWVEGGGWLLSTDWGLDRVITRGFPDRLQILRAGVRTSLTPDETVGARTAGTHPLLEGVPTDGPFRWWLEESSVPFLASEGVDVIVRSEDLGRRNGADPVAATFSHGAGTVLHLIGHVFQQEGNLRGAYAMQRIVVNFLDRALRE